MEEQDPCQKKMLKGRYDPSSRNVIDCTWDKIKQTYESRDFDKFSAKDDKCPASMTITEWRAEQATAARQISLPRGESVETHLLADILVALHNIEGVLRRLEEKE